MEEREIYKKDSVYNSAESTVYNPVTINLNDNEKYYCLKEISNRLKKIMYVYEKSMEPESKYNYKIFLSGLLIYISSSNILFNGELVNLVVNINSILTNDFDKKEIKRIAFESINFTNHLISKYQLLPKEDSNGFN